MPTVKGAQRAEDLVNGMKRRAQDSLPVAFGLRRENEVVDVHVPVG